MPGARWFEGARLNFAENLLRCSEGGNSEKIAITAINEAGARREITYGELYRQVASVAAFLKSEGIVSGDRVAAITSHSPEPVIGMLAATSIGAIWSSCSPDFGVQGIFDRFGQIEPKILIAVDGYQYNGKPFSILDRIREVQKRVPSIQTVVLIPQMNPESVVEIPGAVSWNDAAKFEAPMGLEFRALPFDHPVYILYSSGTTGVPKCIVHGAGGTLLQHGKELMLHTNVGPDDTFTYFTTCGWMMWNWQISGLLTGCKLVLYDGSPSYPSLNRLWELAANERLTIFGTSAKFLGACRNANLSPKDKFDLSRLKTITSTGSPLLPEDFDWVYEHVKPDVLLSSISGGTDIVSCFVLGNPILPVYRGEIQCKGLGMDVAAYSDDGKELIGRQGELVCRKPAPSMPIYFWNDPGGEKYRKAYFSEYPGIWRHGDYILFNERGGAVIYGRSDATLNPSGVRIGTAEIYRQVETMPEISDSLVIGQPWEGDERIVLFIVLKRGAKLTEQLQKKIKTRIREETTPRHVPAKILSIREIPYTISGKKVEMAVLKTIKGEEIKNRDALANPTSLDQFRNLKELLS